MQLKYVDTKEEIIAINRKSKHIEPHLHNALEIVCVTSGALELGVGQELYHTVSYTHLKQAAELKKAEKRKAEVDGLFAKMYEDWSEIGRAHV